MKQKTICFISSSGGHFEQLVILQKANVPLKKITITERTNFNGKEKDTYYIRQINRKEFFFIYNMLLNSFTLFKIFISEKPDIIVSTGALCCIPMFIIGKLYKKKLIFIESFSKVNSPTLTGKFIYRFADLFIVQWESLKKFYPNAIYMGSIY